MKKVIFIKNTLILSASALILRLVGVAFKIWLSARIGSEAIGLYQVLMSVYIFAGSFASSGISTAVTRLSTEALINGGGVRRVVSRGITITLLAATITCSLLFFGADLIAVHFIGDARAALPCRFMSLGLIFMGICSCLRGYFLARRSALSSSVSQIIEQIVRIVVISVLINRFGKNSVTAAICAIVIGDAVAEASSALFLWILYRLDIMGREDNSFAGDGTTKKMLGIALPISAGRYLSTLLRTSESSAVPRLLCRYGYSSAEALSLFGALRGMALPLLLFPSAVLSAVSLLLIPELSEARTKGGTPAVRNTVSSVLKITTLLAFIVGAVFWFCGESLAMLLYSDASVGKCVKLLAPLTPLMYIDSISDGMLKGLDKQSAAFRYAVTDSGMRLLLVFLILPRYGFSGFIFIMYISNILTAVLHFSLLSKTAELKLNVTEFLILPLLYSISICAILSLALPLLSLSLSVYVIAFCALSAGLYLLALHFSGLITREKLYL